MPRERCKIYGFLHPLQIKFIKEIMPHCALKLKCYPNNSPLGCRAYFVRNIAHSCVYQESPPLCASGTCLMSAPNLKPTFNHPSVLQ